MAYYALLLMLMAAVTPLLVALVSRIPAIGFYAIGVFAVIAWEHPEPINIGSFGGIHAHLEDVLMIVLLFAALNRIRRNTPALPGARLWLVLLVLTVLGLLRGVATYGLGPAVNDFRAFMNVGIIILWVNAVSPGMPPEITHAWFRRLGWVLTSIAVYHAARFGIGSADSALDVPGEFRTGRVLVAGQALMLALSGLYLLGIRLQGRQSGSLVAPSVFLVIAVLSQHRSVWIGTAVAIASMLAVAPRGRRAILALWFGTAAALTAMLFSLGTFSQIRQEFLLSLTSNGTYNGRVDGWVVLVDHFRGSPVTSQIVGLPFGSGYDRVVGGYVESFAPHNWYVSMLLRTGFIGLAMWLSVTIWLVIRAAKSADRAVLIPIVAALVAFQWAYTLTWYVAPALGWVLVASGAPRPSRDALPSLTQGASASGDHDRVPRSGRPSGRKAFVVSRVTAVMEDKSNGAHDARAQTTGIEGLSA